MKWCTNPLWSWEEYFPPVKAKFELLTRTFPSSDFVNGLLGKKKLAIGLKGIVDPNSPLMSWHATVNQLRWGQ